MSKSKAGRKAAASTITPPLQLLMLKEPKDAEVVPFEEAVDRAVKGGLHNSGYVASGEDLGIEIRKFTAPSLPVADLRKLLDGACHTVVVALVGEALVNDPNWCRFLAKTWSYIQGSRRHTLLLFVVNERVGDQLRRKEPALASNTAVSIDQLAERALRPAFVSLRVLHEARQVLSASLGSGVPAFLTLFISHAKLDGLPLAQSLKHLIESVKWLTSFYDARDLASVTDWQAELERAATSSLLIILRTDNYEQRLWCQKETLWAEETATPTVLIEARPGLLYPAGELPLERMPSVRIPDGNLFRIIHAALRESVRYLMFQRRVAEMRSNGIISKKLEVVAFSYPPGMSALLRACRKVGAKRGLIIYPDPPLRRGLYEAAEALVKVKARRTRLVTPNLLSA